MMGVGLGLGLTVGAGGWAVSGVKEVISCWMAACPGGVAGQASVLESRTSVARLIMSWASEEVGSRGMSAVSVEDRRQLVGGKPVKYVAGIIGMRWREVWP